MFSSPFTNERDETNGAAPRKRAKASEKEEEAREYHYDNPDHPFYRNLEPAMIEVASSPSSCSCSSSTTTPPPPPPPPPPPS